MTRLIVLVSIFLLFTGWSLTITVEHGYWGFLDVLFAGGWQSQVFVDLALGLTMCMGGMKRDAQRQGIVFWPYLVALPFVGSISPLAYLIHRQVKKLQGTETVVPVSS